MSSVVNLMFHQAPLNHLEERPSLRASNPSPSLGEATARVDMLRERIARPNAKYTAGDSDCPITDGIHSEAGVIARSNLHVGPSPHPLVPL